jgi:hypothetical protein
MVSLEFFIDIIFSGHDLRKMGVKNWKQRAQERKQWKEIIERAKTLSGRTVALGSTQPITEMRTRNIS